MDYTVYLEDIRKKLVELLEERKVANNYRERNGAGFF